MLRSDDFRVLGKHARREPERARVVGGARPGLDQVDRGAQARHVGARALGDRVRFLVVGHQHELVLRPQGRQQVLGNPARQETDGSFGCGGSHAAALIHQRHHRGGRPASGRSEGSHRRATHRQRQGRHREGAQQQQDPLLELEPADLAAVDLGKEFDRREWDVPRAFAGEQVDQDRHTGGEQPEQEQRVEEAHRASSAKVPVESSHTSIAVTG